MYLEIILETWLSLRSNDCLFFVLSFPWTCVKNETIAVNGFALLTKKEIHTHLRMPCVLSMSTDRSNRKSVQLTPKWFVSVLFHPIHRIQGKLSEVHSAYLTLQHSMETLKTVKFFPVLSLAVADCTGLSTGPCPATTLVQNTAWQV